MREVGCAIVGCGVIAPVHAEALSSLERARLVAAVDVVPGKARDLAAKYGAEYWFDDYSRVLARDDVDAVFICTPHYLHVPMIVDAARSGKHVLVEKPLAIDSEGAALAIEACKSAGVRLAVCFQNRLNPATLEVKRAIESGILGEVVGVHGDVSWFRPDEYYLDSPWRGRWDTEGGGVLINQAIHTLDLMLHFAGDVEGHSSKLARVGHSTIEVEDVAAVSIKFVNGAVGSLFATTCAYPGSDVRIEIIGTKGSALIEGDKLIRFETMTGRTCATPGDDCEPVESAKPYYGASHRKLIADFIESICDNRSPYVTGEEGRRSVDLLDAIYREYRQQDPRCSIS